MSLSHSSDGDSSWRSTGLADRTTTDALATEVLARDRAEVAHQRSRLGWLLALSEFILRV